MAALDQYKSDPEADDVDIYVINADGSNLTQVTHGPALDMFPTLSPLLQ